MYLYNLGIDENENVNIDVTVGMLRQLIRSSPRLMRGSVGSRETRRAFSERGGWSGHGVGGQNHWSHRLVTKLPGNNLNMQAFTASMILCFVLCAPKYLMDRGKDVKPGHSMFDQEQPEEIQLQRAEERRQQARQRIQ